MTLRIQESIEHGLVVFNLTGRIQIEQVYELIALLRSQSSPQTVVLDLEQVKLVDRDAVLFLALSEASGVRLRNCPAYIRQWINQERNSGRNGSEGAAESADQGE
jgi:anti-anti-sigma regulatory factor